MKFEQRRILLWVAIFTIFPAHTVLAAGATPAKISWGFLMIGLLGGLARFL